MQENNTNNLYILHTPKTIAETVKLYNKHPNSVIYAGGSSISENKAFAIEELTNNIICLQDVSEMSKIKKSERFIDIGATATLYDILSLKKSTFVPAVLTKAINSIGTPSLRTIATIGGNLAIKDKILTLIPVLIILNARLEIRSENSSRWLYLSQENISSEEHFLKSNEIISKIRIPLKAWDSSSYLISNKNIFTDKSFMSLSSAIKRGHKSITEIKFIFNIGYFRLIRSRITEEAIIGKNLPLSKSDTKSIVEIFIRDIDSQTQDLSHYKKQNIINFFQLMLSEL